MLSGWPPGAAVISSTTERLRASLVAQTVKNSPAMLDWEDSPGEGDGYPVQHSCLENPTNREAWKATGHSAAKSQTQLSN